jgi:acylglycerol lipase
MCSPSQQPTKEFIHTILCDDGYRLSYRFSPAVGTSLGTVVLVPGMISHSGWFHEITHLITGYQFDVIGADRRGSGLNKQRRGDIASREILMSDHRKILNESNPGLPRYLLGWCWGAIVAVNVALELGSELSGVVLLAPGLFPSRKVKDAARHASDSVGMTDPLSAILPSPVSEEMFSDRPSVQSFIRNDDLAQRTFTTRFFGVSRQMSMLATVRLSQLTQPLLILLAKNDAAVDNRQTLDALRFKSATDVTVSILPSNHAMQFELPHEVARQLSRWLQYRSRPHRDKSRYFEVVRH